MPLFEIKAPDGRLIRQHHESLEAARASLTAGYDVVGACIWADAAGKGGFVEKPGGPTLMSVLLQEHGDELLAWLQTRGEPFVVEFVGKDQQ